jgi:hypothetical protein
MIRVLKSIFTKENIANVDPVIPNTSEQITISVDADKEDVDIKFNVHNKDKFLHLIAIVVSGSLTESLTKVTFDSLEGDEAKQAFLNLLAETAEKNLETASSRPLIQPSEFLI